MTRLFLAAALLTAAGAARAEDPPPPTPELPGTRVGEIRVERVNVFDPAVKGEDWWPFRAANKLHYPTREYVIRRELLFAPGDAWDPLKVIQSERNLRANGAFRRADVIPVARPDGRIDAVVRAQDSWTTNPRLSLGTEGGESFFAFGLEEGNVLGYGKSLSFDHSRNGPRTSNSFAYGDPRFLGTRMALGTSYAKGNRGDSNAVALTRPFYALEAHRGTAVSWNRSVSEISTYQNGAEYSKFRQRRRVTEGSLGARISEDVLFVQRAEAGWYSDRAQFENMVETNGLIPGNRELSGPTAGYSWVRPRYVKENYIDRMERVEDFNLGNELSFRGGWMAGAFGSDRDRFIFNLSEQQGFRAAPGRFALVQVGLKGRAAGGHADNAVLYAGLSSFWKTHWRGDHTVVAHLEGSTGRYLDRENQITLGGNTGLRGYKNNSFNGGKAVLLNLEDRFFFPGEWFHLVRFGAVIFLDSGVVADEGANLAWRAIKTDVGAGLRLGSTRSRSGAVARVDLAYALNRGPGSSRWVLSISGGQAFSLFNSASQRVDTAPASRLN